MQSYRLRLRTLTVGRMDKKPRQTPSNTALKSRDDLGFAIDSTFTFRARGLMEQAALSIELRLFPWGGDPAGFMGLRRTSAEPTSSRPGGEEASTELPPGDP